MLEPEPELGSIEDAINHIEAALHAIVDEARGALAVDEEEGWRLPYPRFAGNSMKVCRPSSKARSGRQAGRSPLIA